MKTTQADLALADERLLIGIALADPGRAVEVVALLPPDDCARPEHRRLIELFAEQLAAGKPIDLQSIASVIVERGADRYGGLSYVLELPDRVPSLQYDLVAAAGRIHQRALRLELQRIGQALIQVGREEPATLEGDALPDEPEAAASDVAHHLAGLARPAAQAEWSIGEAADEAAEIRARERAAGRPQAHTTGHPELDQVLDGGFRPGELIVVAGRPGAGKTAFGLGCAVDLARQGFPVGIISLEMGAAELGDRVLSRVTQQPLSRVRRGDCDDDETVIAWRKALRGWGLRVYAPDSVRPPEIVAQARRWRARGLSMLLVDYLQLVSHERGESHNLAVGSTATALKRLARQLGVPVVLLSQLSRDVERRSPPRRRHQPGRVIPWWDTIALPQLADLRDSGQIEQDADVVLFPVRAQQYGLDDVAPSDACIVVAKNRNGRTGIVRAEWEGRTASYLEALP